MEIRNSVLEDMEIIQQLCAADTEFQKSKTMVSWPHFEPLLIETEIREKRQWKMVLDSKIACVWAITESDPQIWRKKIQHHRFIFITLLLILIFEVKI